jgi:hypothetical protein
VAVAVDHVATALETVVLVVRAAEAPDYLEALVKAPRQVALVALAQALLAVRPALLAQVVRPALRVLQMPAVTALVRMPLPVTMQWRLGILVEMVVLERVEPMVMILLAVQMAVAVAVVVTAVAVAVVPPPITAVAVVAVVVVRW